MDRLRKRIGALAAVAALAAAATGPAAAQPQDMRMVVVNDSAAALVQLYVGRRQVLGQPLGPGLSVTIDGNDGQRGCQKDVTAVFSDGTTKTSSVNVCAVGQYPATARGVPQCPGDTRCKRNG